MFYSSHKYYCPDCMTKYRIAPGYTKFGPAPHVYICRNCARRIFLSSERFDYYMMLAWKLWILFTIVWLVLDSIGKEFPAFNIQVIGGTILLGVIIGFFASYILVFPVMLVYDTFDILLGRSDSVDTGPPKNPQSPSAAQQQIAPSEDAMPRDQLPARTKESLPAEKPSHPPDPAFFRRKQTMVNRIEEKWKKLCKPSQQADFIHLHTDKTFPNQAEELIRKASTGPEDAIQLVDSVFDLITRKEKISVDDDPHGIYYGARTADIHVDVSAALDLLCNLNLLERKE